MMVLQERPQNGAKEKLVEVIVVTINNSIYKQVRKQKTKELKCKNGTRKKMIEHATFKIGNLQG